MANVDKQLAESIRSGAYFERSRDWYQSVFIGPLSERSFFLLIATIAFAVCFMGGLALYRILPITNHPAIMVNNPRLSDTYPRLIALKPTSRTPLNEALQQFFISNYVLKREGYSLAEYDANQRFVQNQSDDLAFAEYKARYDRANPNSPASILAATGQRIVTIESIELNTGVEPKLATVKFFTEIKGVENGATANWTAVVEYYYDDMIVTSSVNTLTGDEIFKTQDPQFKVVHYALTQAR